MRPRLFFATAMLVTVALISWASVVMGQPVQTPAASASVVVLQQGVQGYTGATDAYLDRWTPTEHWGGAGWLMVTASEDRSALLRFDLSGYVPAGASIRRATLELFLAQRNRPLPENVAVFGVRRRWVERETTWLRAAIGQSWGVAGCNDTALDRTAEPSDTLRVSSGTGWHHVDVTRLAQRWVDDPSSNWGVLLKGQSEGLPIECVFLSSQSGQVQNRPILRVEYTPGPAPTPAPSAVVRFNPSRKVVSSVNSPFGVDVHLEGVSDLGALQARVDFDPSVVLVEGVTLGGLVSGTARTFTLLGPQIDNTAGTLAFGIYSYGSQPGPSGSGAVATVTFRAVHTGRSTLRLAAVQLLDHTGASMAVSTQEGSIEVQAGLVGDVDGDCDVDLADIMLVAVRWGSRRGDANYDARYDLDNDGDIDVADIMFVASHWGETCGAPSSPGRPALEPQESDVTPRIHLESSSDAVGIGDSVTVNVVADGAAGIGGFELTLTYDPKVFRARTVTLGDCLTSAGRTGVSSPVIDHAEGRVVLRAFSYGPAAGPCDNGTLASVTLEALASGASDLTLSDLHIADRRGRMEPAIPAHGSLVRVDQSRAAP